MLQVDNNGERDLRIPLNHGEREVAVLKLVYIWNDEQLPADPGEVKCTPPTWQKFLSSANSLAALSWEACQGQMVDELTGQLQQYEGLIPSGLEELPQESQQLEENMSYSQCV